MDCIICNSELHPDDDIITCPNCEVQFHEKEFAELMNTQNTCPKCKWDFDPYLIFELSDKYSMTIPTHVLDRNMGAMHFYGKEKEGLVLIIPLIAVAVFIFFLELFL